MLFLHAFCRSWIVILCLGVTPLPPSAQQQRPQQQPQVGPGNPRLPDGYTFEKDLAYVEGGHSQQRLDIAYPSSAEKAVPLVVWIHGGAWRGGSKRGGPAYSLVEDGYAVASVEYRFSQDAVFPAQIQDCKAAIRWLRANAARFHIKPDRIGVWGSSAGGHLVSLLGTAGDVAGFDVGGNLDQTSRVHAVVNFFGPTNLLTMGVQGGNERRGMKTDSVESPEGRLLGANPQEVPEKAKQASPVFHVTPDDAPFLTVHGDKDPLVPVAQGLELNEALKLVGVETELIVIEGGGHGGKEFDAPETRAKIRAFLAKNLMR
jgi:acetyl esterase/lipase